MRNYWQNCFTQIEDIIQWSSFKTYISETGGNNIFDSLEDKTNLQQKINHLAITDMAVTFNARSRMHEEHVKNNLREF